MMMAISANTRQVIANEFKFISEKIKSETELPAKVYYFSGTYGLTQRLLNLEFDSNIVLMHIVLNYTYNLIKQLLVRITSGEEKVITFPPKLFNSLANSIDELGRKIVKNEDTTSVLQDITVIGYATTGNGYYLYQKGIIKI
jgi:hypothetical protein